MSLQHLELFNRLADHENILLAGMGGGFDLYCGLPLYFALTAAGKKVTLTNMTFASTNMLGPRLSRAMVEITADSGPPKGYFPERHLCAWMRQRQHEISVFCVERYGTIHVQQGYEALIQHRNIDALVMIDGGTDSLMRGDEPSLGTPHEDILSLAVAAELQLDTKLLVCLGFGIDAFHGVCHAHMLQNVAALMQKNAFLGCFSLLPQMPEVKLYIEAVDYANACTPHIWNSIVNNSIVSALEGNYGNIHRLQKTKESTLWINPLMSIYWTFELDAVADQVLYLDIIKNTETFQDVIDAIEIYEATRTRRDWEEIPV